ncbi:MAG: hypothetical protein KF752_19135 [Pirellulaceae bacterium]|nr:hypothetical protein [Pirellulaceae bacterium]
MAKWLLGEFGRVSDRLTAAINEGPLPTSCSDSDKAELLLGYLSRSEKAEEAGARADSDTIAEPTAASA